MRLRCVSLLFCPSCLCRRSVSSAAASPVARVAATPIPEATAIRVDGDLNDAIWQTVPPITEFPTARPARRGRADLSDRSASRLRRDRALRRRPGLRLRIRSASLASARGATRTRPSDWVSVLVDSFHDRRSAFEFAVNPAGVKQDSYWFNDTNNDQGWDAVWDVAVSRGEQGWRAEFRIPFSQLRYRPSETSTFGLAIVRTIGRLERDDPRGRCCRRAPTATSRRSAS